MNMRVWLLAAVWFGSMLAPTQAQTPDAIGARLNRLEAGATQLAQLLPRPPREIPLDDNEDAPLRSLQDSGALVLRVDRLENQLRNLTGQIEQMQFQQRKLEDALRKFQQDVDFRFQDGGKRTAPAKRTDLGGVSDVIASPGPTASKPRRPNGQDSFDPTLDPTAPGAPRTIGTLDGSDVVTAPRPPLVPVNPIIQGEPGAPIDINRGNPTQNTTVGLPPIGVQTPPSAPLSEYDQAVVALKQAQYEVAESGFKSYLQKTPNGRLASDAIFNLGETYFQRQRHREAAEQYLKLSTDFAKSNRAPDGLVKLGMSLNALGAKEQACAAFGEVARKYPAAVIAIRGANRESKRANC